MSVLLARGYERGFDFVALNKAALSQAIPSEHEQALVVDASFIAKSGNHTYGLERFWNSTQGRAQRGLEISLLAWLDITDNCAYALSVEQTPPSDPTTEAQGSRMKGYLAQVRRLVSAHDLSHLRYVITDGFYSKRTFIQGLCDLGLEQIGKLRHDANLRYLYQGPKRPGPGRPRTYDGKVRWDDLSRFECLDAEDGVRLYHRVLNHVQWRRNLRVVRVVTPPRPPQSRALQHRYGVAGAQHLSLLQGAFPSRVSVSRCQAVYGPEQLSSAFTGQACLSLQCQPECADVCQTRRSLSTAGAV